jgi:hypothetical protein
MAVAPSDDGVTEGMGELDVPGLVGGSVVILPGEPRYRLPIS